MRRFGAPVFTGRCRYRCSSVSSRVTSRSVPGGLRSVRTIWSTLMWPQPPVARSTISSRAVLPARSPHVPAAGSSRSLPPGSVFGPAAVRTTLPSTSRFMQVSPAQPPPPIEEADRPSIDRERRGREHAGGPVAAGERVDEPAALEALDGHLARQGAPRRPAAEGGALGDPPAVVVALEIGEDDVGGLRPGRRQPGPDRISAASQRKVGFIACAVVTSFHRGTACRPFRNRRCAPSAIGAGGSRIGPDRVLHPSQLFDDSLLAGGLGLLGRQNGLGDPGDGTDGRARSQLAQDFPGAGSAGLRPARRQASWGHPR